MLKLTYKIKLLLLYLLSLILATFLVYKLLNTMHETSVENISIQHFKNKAIEREEYLHDFLNPYITTIKSIQQSTIVQAFLSGNVKREAVEEYFLNLKRALPCATQIRFIDLKGNESIRIDGTPVSLMKEKAISKIVPLKDLQDKAPCPYIKNFLQLDKTALGISKIELNKNPRGRALSCIRTKLLAHLYDVAKSEVF